MKNKLIGTVYKVNIEKLEDNKICEKLKKFTDSNLICFDNDGSVLYFYTNGRTIALSYDSVEKYLKKQKDMGNVLSIDNGEVDYFKKSDSGNVTVCFIGKRHVGVSRVKGYDCSVDIIGKKVAYNKAKIKKLKQSIKSNEEFIRTLENVSIKNSKDKIEKCKNEIKKLESEIKMF